MLYDASAVIAYLQGESGGEIAEAHFDDGLITTVNLAEVLTVMVNLGESADGLRDAANDLPFDVVDVTTEDAIVAAELRATTRHLGLSLGDRVCLAVAKRLGVPALTADRAWGELAPDVGVETVLIR